MVAQSGLEKVQNNRKLPQTFTLEQIKHHDSPDDLWMVIYNKVYDVTSFTPSHPGSAEVLFDCGGVDATEAFEDVAHSDDAFQMLAPFYVGDLRPEECRTYSVSRNPSSNFDFSGKGLQEQEIPNQEECQLKLPRNVIEKITFIMLVVITIISMLLYLNIQKMKWFNQGNL